MLKDEEKIKTELKNKNIFIDNSDLSNNEDYRGRLMSERMEKNLLEQDAYFTTYSMGVDIGIEQGSVQKQSEMIIDMYNKHIDIKILLILQN